MLMIYKKYLKYSIIPAFVICILCTFLPAQASEKQISLHWDVTPITEIELAGFRLYRTGESKVLCESTTPEAREMECLLDITDIDTTYTLTSFDSYGMESDPSGPMRISFSGTVAELAADFTYFVAPAQSLTVSFDATSSVGEPIQYSWNFGDGILESGEANLSHTFPSSGNYTVILTVSDGIHQDEVSQNITVVATAVNSLPLIVLSSSSTVGKPPLNVRFDASQSSDPDGDTLSYFWDFGDGKTGQGKKISHLYKNQGSYTASVTITDSAGVSAYTTLPIIVSGSDGILSSDNIPQAVIMMVKNTDTKDGSTTLTVSFDGSKSTASAINSSIVQYAWNFGDGQTASGQVVKHSYSEPALFTASLIITDSTGLQATTNIKVDLRATGDVRRKANLLPVYQLLLQGE